MLFPNPLAAYCRWRFHRNWFRLGPSERHDLLTSEIRVPLFQATNNPAAYTLTDTELSEWLEGQVTERPMTPAEVRAEYITVLEFEDGLDALDREDVEGWLDELDGVEAVKRWLGLKDLES